MLAFFGMPGQFEWIVIAVVVLILFGAGAIPRFARNVGRAKSEFEKGLRDKGDEDGADSAEPDDAKAGKDN